MKALALLLALGLLPPAPALAHDLPVSSVTLRLGAAGIEAEVEAPAVDLAHDLPEVEPSTLLTVAGAEAHKAKLASLITARLAIAADGVALRGDLRGIEPLPETRDVRLRLHFSGSAPRRDLRVRCRLFPSDPRHKTFFNLYRDGTLERQALFEGENDALDYPMAGGSRQSVAAVVQTFVAEGVHHIFIGPDHILFIVGLLLLGGTVARLLKIVTAFTVAHSLTLALATLDLFNPSPRFVEPAIALSIVFVGAHSLMLAGENRRGDARLFFAFGFGLLHGFGFAGVLRELDLPRYALGWSLFSFNLGVEIGQSCIVLAVAPILALIRRRSERVAGRVVTVGSLGVIAAGAFWFVQRVLG
jgi:hydrogenase/urease accessory protein HupE